MKSPKEWESWLVDHTKWIIRSDSTTGGPGGYTIRDALIVFQREALEPHKKDDDPTFQEFVAMIQADVITTDENPRQF